MRKRFGGAVSARHGAAAPRGRKGKNKKTHSRILQKAAQPGAPRPRASATASSTSTAAPRAACGALSTRYARAARCFCCCSMGALGAGPGRGPRPGPAARAARSTTSAATSSTRMAARKARKTAAGLCEGGQLRGATVQTRRTRARCARPGRAPRPARARTARVARRRQRRAAPTAARAACARPTGAWQCEGAARRGREGLVKTKVGNPQSRLGCLRVCFASRVCGGMAGGRRRRALRRGRGHTTPTSTRYHMMPSQSSSVQSWPAGGGTAHGHAARGRAGRARRDSIELSSATMGRA